MIVRIHRLTLILAATGWILLTPPVGAESAEHTAFLGQWLSKDKDAVYDLRSCAAGLCGTLIGTDPHVQKDGKPNVGGGREVLTLVNWDGAKQRWEGKVMDPESNKKDSVTLESKNGAPLMKVSWGLMSFSESWTRFSGSVSPQCEIKVAAQ